MKYAIKIDNDTLAHIVDLAGPYFGAEDCAPLAKAVRADLQDAHPGVDVEVVHIYNRPDLAVPLIRLMVIVDGQMDQGLMLTRPAKAPSAIKPAVVNGRPVIEDMVAEFMAA